MTGRDFAAVGRGSPSLLIALDGAACRGAAASVQEPHEVTSVIRIVLPCQPRRSSLAGQGAPHDGEERAGPALVPARPPVAIRASAMQRARRAAARA